MGQSFEVCVYCSYSRIAGFFSSVCEASANEDIVDEVQYNQDGSITEGLDDIDEPLISHMRGSDRETSEAALVDPASRLDFGQSFLGSSLLVPSYSPL